MVRDLKRTHLPLYFIALSTVLPLFLQLYTIESMRRSWELWELQTTPRSERIHHVLWMKLINYMLYTNFCHALSISLFLLIYQENGLINAWYNVLSTVFLT